MLVRESDRCSVTGSGFLLPTILVKKQGGEEGTGGARMPGLYPYLRHSFNIIPACSRTVKVFNIIRRGWLSQSSTGETGNE